MGQCSQLAALFLWFTLYFHFREQFILYAFQSIHPPLTWHNAPISLRNPSTMLFLPYSANFLHEEPLISIILNIRTCSRADIWNKLTSFLSSLSTKHLFISIQCWNTGDELERYCTSQFQALASLTMTRSSDLVELRKKGSKSACRYRIGMWLGSSLRRYGIVG